MSRHEPYHTVVAGLECLTDAQLCAIVARAQSLLLDRPTAAEGTPRGAVEVVTWDEAWVLAHHRALPRCAQCHLRQSLNETRSDAVRAAQQHEGERRRAAPLSAAADGAELAVQREHLALAQEVAHLGIFEMTHDLKNPLATIKGRVQLLQQRAARARGLTPEWLLSGLGDVDAAATKMARYIDQLLDVARAQAGRPSQPERQPTDLVALARRVAAEHQQGTARHQIQVRVAAPEVVGPWDAARLERLLDNLLGNAVTYSPADGAVTVTVACEDDASGRWAVLTVRDQGLGIPPADLPRLFEHLYRGSNVANRIRGSGLGLTSARQIVEMHGGTITVQSEEGVGSTFTVRLPLTVPDTAEDPATTSR